MRIAASLALLLSIAFFLPMPEDSAALENLDSAQVRLGLAFFACIAFLWMTEALPLAVTAILVPVIAAAMGLASVKDSLASFAAPPIFLFFGGFALASALSAQGLDRWLATNLARLGKGKFVPVSVCLFGGTALLSMWMSNTATTAMMLPLAMGILSRFPAETRNAHFLLLGLAYSASIGGLGTIVGSPPNGIAAKELGVTFAEWMRFGIPAVLVLLPAMILTLHLLLKPSNGEFHEEPEAETFAFTAQRTITLGIFALTALAWIFSAQLGKLLGITDTDTWIALAAVALLAATRVVGWQEIEKGTDWGVLLLFGGGLALSAILGSSGASLFMARLLGGAIGAWPLWAIVAAVVAFVIFLTELSSNTASAALLVPIFIAMSAEFGLSATTLVLPLALAASCAFMLPVGTPPNAIVFGTGRIPQREMIRVGF
ncbi:MAG TPA: SLC13 family permease, partial [Sphingomonadaceae bacterium]|nr:SLC13 family permease [Sphingomonadaceae bacterium]